MRVWVFSRVALRLGQQRGHQRRSQVRPRMRNLLVTRVEGRCALGPSLDTVLALLRARAWFLHPTAAKAVQEHLHILTPPHRPSAPKPGLRSCVGQRT